MHLYNLVILTIMNIIRSAFKLKFDLAFPILYYFFFLLLLIYFTNNFAVLTVVLGTTTLYVGCLIASRILHDSMLKNIMHAKMSFFNITPSGRILNRVAKDVDIIDITLPPILLSWNRCLIMVSA